MLAFLYVLRLNLWILVKCFIIIIKTILTNNSSHALVKLETFAMEISGNRTSRTDRIPDVKY